MQRRKFFYRPKTAMYHHLNIIGTTFGLPLATSDMAISGFFWQKSSGYLLPEMTFDTGLKIFALIIRSWLNSAEVGKHIIFLNVDLYQRKDFKSAKDKTLIVLENKKFVDRTTIYIIFKETKECSVFQRKKSVLLYYSS